MVISEEVGASLLLLVSSFLLFSCTCGFILG
jgi:hypothetical protein